LRTARRVDTPSIESTSVCGSIESRCLPSGETVGSEPGRVVGANAEPSSFTEYGATT